jgi:hypothetical protein
MILSYTKKYYFYVDYDTKTQFNFLYLRNSLIAVYILVTSFSNYFPNFEYVRKIFRNGSSKTFNRWYESENNNISKSRFFVQLIEYLGYWITRQGIQPIRKKVDMNDILYVKAPKRTTNYSGLLIVHYYREKWFLRNESS